MKDYLHYLEILDDIRKDQGARLLQKHRLVCGTGDWHDSAVLKLQKKEWTAGGIGEGLFFSVWVGEKDLKKQRVNYNIHALHLRLLKGYSIKPRTFADDFRSRLKGTEKNWPNLSMDYGPQTLMQGWIPLDSKGFRKDVCQLMKNFIAMHSLIDELLEEKRASKT